MSDKKKFGNFSYRFTDANDNAVCFGRRTSLDPHHDHAVMDKALSFDDAQRRNVGVHINALVPKWKAKMIKVLFGVGMVLALTACDTMATPTYQIDRKIYAERFDACMKVLPAGPSHLTASGNDWDETVTACDFAAYRQAKVCIANCNSGEYY